MNPRRQPKAIQKPAGEISHGLRIVAIVNAFGGSGISGLEHALALAERGHRVTMLTYSENSLPLVVHPNLAVRAVEPVFWGGTPYPDLVVCFAAAIRHTADERPVDIIHAHYAVTHGEAAILGHEAIVQDLRSPEDHHRPAVVITCHGTDVTRFATDPRVAPALRHILTRAHGLTFVSKSLQSLAVRQLQLTQQGRVIPNFLSIWNSPPVPGNCVLPNSFCDSVVFFHVSRFQIIKNVSWIVRAFDAALRLRPVGSIRLKLLLVGDGPTRKAAEELAQQLGIINDVVFVGTVPYEQVREIVRQGDVLLMASDAEGCPLVVLEAMAEGKPVIGTNVDGLNEVINDGHTGRLCPPGDLEFYAETILEFANDEFTRRQFGSVGRAEFERRYNCAMVMSAYEEVYEQALARANACIQQEATSAEDSGLREFSSTSLATR
jgi:L-malate glycosyltransferase